MKKIILILVLCLWNGSAFAMSELMQFRVEKELYFLMSKEPFVYVWGGIDPYGKGADCSGYIYGVMKQLQVPVVRTTALEMSMGLKGWTFRKIDLRSLTSTDVVWFSFSPSRPFGHIGLMILSLRSGVVELAHASSTKKRFSVEPLKGSLLKGLSKEGRFTFGEKSNQ